VGALATIENKPCVEVLPPLPPEVYLQRSPFAAAQPVHVEVPEGATVAEYVAAVAKGMPPAYHPHLHAMIGEMTIARENWSKVRPKAGYVVTVRVLPAGKGGKNILRIVVMVAVVAAAAYFLGPGSGLVAGLAGGSATAAAGISAALVATATTVATLALNALIPPPGLTSSDSAKPRYQLTGTSNRMEPYAQIPRVFGKMRLFPMLAARPYTEVQGSDQYIRMLLIAGFGPLRISDLRIGDTDFDLFANAEYEVHEGGPDGWAGNKELTLFSRQVREESLGIVLAPNAEVQQTTRPNTTEVQVDVAFPQGLIGYTKKGAKESRTVNILVQYRATGTTGTWQQARWVSNYDGVTGSNGRITAKAQSQEAARFTGAFKVPKGQYDIQLIRTTAAGVRNSDGSAQIDDSAWTALRSVIDDKPVDMEGVTLIAVRLKASDQLNGVPNTINCIAESYLPVRAGGAWSYQITRSPAWAYADTLRRRGRETLIPDSRIDLDYIQQWAVDCDPKWEFNGVFEGGSVFNVLRQIAAVGRASYTMRDGLFSVVRDVAQPTPVQHITPRNSWGYSGNKTFVKRPHCLRVRFKNAEKDYAEDEVPVYDDGYNEANSTEFETLDLTLGCTSRAQAWREGRYHLAVAILRPEEHRVSMDVEALRCAMGSRVQLTHDVILAGLGFGRVIGRIFGGGQVIGVQLDSEIEMLAGKTYALRTRGSDGASAVYSLQVVDGIARQAMFRAPVSPSVAPEEDDLFMFGETGLESAPMIVKRIDAGEDLSCTLSLVAYDPAIHASDTQPIPAFSSFITQPYPDRMVRPAAPRSIKLRSDDSVIDVLQDGTTTVRIAVDITPPGSSPVLIAGWEVQFREGDGLWMPNPNGTALASLLTVFSPPVRPEAVWSARVRSVTEFGASSEWVTEDNHAIVGKTEAPGVPSPVSTVGAYRSIRLSWFNPIDSDLAFVEVLAASTSSLANAALIGSAANGAFVIEGLNPGDRRWVWLRSVDLSGNRSDPILAGNATALALDDADGDVAANNAKTLLEIADAEVRRLRDRGLYLAGPDAATPMTLFQRAEENRIEADSALRSIIEIMVAVAPGGKAVVLRGESVFVTKEVAGVVEVVELSARFGENEGAIEQINTVLANENGTVSRALLRVRADGKIIGYDAYNDGKTGIFDFTADAFSITDPDTGEALFYVDEQGAILNNVRVNTLTANAVKSANIESGAVMSINFQETQSDYSVARGNVDTVASVTFVKSQANTALKVTFFGSFWSQDDLQYNCSIVVDGNVSYPAGQQNNVFDQQNSNARSTVTPFKYITGLAAGQHTIAFNVYNTETDNIPLTIKMGSVLEVIEFKQGAM
jgi:hypothetical protein